jgi:glycosyltransferase involved in cell wall biosynthesis
MNDKPQVIAFITSYVPFIGGVEVALQQVTSRLAGDFEFLIITGRYDRRLPRLERKDGATVYRVGIGRALDKWLLPASALRIRRAISGDWDRRRRRMLWGLDITQASLSAALMRRVDGRVPFLLTIQYGESPERLERGRWGMIRRSFEFMLGQADHVTAISSPLAGYARLHGYDRSVTIIPNGVDPSIFRSAGRATEDRAPTVLCVSRLVRKNGIDVLLKAVSLLRLRVPTVECRIIGGGPERVELEALAGQLGLNSSVRFLGELPHRAIVHHMLESDVFVRPSRSEGMGTAFVEAMAFGLPVIGTPVGGIVDVITNGETGLVANADQPTDLADKMERLLADQGLAKRLASQAQAWARAHHDVDMIAVRYGELFRELMGP